MSKVIHVSDSTHQLAKAFCQQKGVCMSEWVTELISQHAQKQTPSDKAVPQPNLPPRHTATMPARHASSRPNRANAQLDVSDLSGAKQVGLVEKKPTLRYEGGPKSDDEQLSSCYSAPPFWAQSSTAP